MANKNRKTIPKEELESMQEGSKLAKEQQTKDKNAIKKAEKQMFDRDKANLPQVLEQRLQEISTVLESELESTIGLKAPKIHRLISRQSIANTSSMIGYSTKELYIVYESYQQLVEKINEFTMFVPSIKSFCAFAGFSTNTFKNMLQSPDEEKRNVAQMIDDYISDMLLDGSKMRKIDASTAIFTAKSEHGMTEATNPQVIQYESKVDLNNVFDRINQIKSGKVVDAEFKVK